MSWFTISTVGFLNDKTYGASIARLGQATLPNGVSPRAIATLAALTCQAHDIHLPGMRPEYDGTDLQELMALGLVHWVGDETVNLV